MHMLNARIYIVFQIKWLNVGVLGGEEEEILGGYVWQSDHAGIKATWLASDPESGVGGVAVAVGTSPGNLSSMELLISVIYSRTSMALTHLENMFETGVVGANEH